MIFSSSILNCVIESTMLMVVLMLNIAWFSFEVE